ncbi:MAG: hypothetical protein EPN93_07880 [Spirochaetes bacterium]|nr:MAG: hypothetical protein EPN93_07880 [Spirochaetota bacterium]
MGLLKRTGTVIFSFLFLVVLAGCFSYPLKPSRDEFTHFTAGQMPEYAKFPDGQDFENQKKFLLQQIHIDGTISAAEKEAKQKKVEALAFEESRYLMYGVFSPDQLAPNERTFKFEFPGYDIGELVGESYPVVIQKTVTSKISTSSSYEYRFFLVMKKPLIPANFGSSGLPLILRVTNSKNQVQEYTLIEGPGSPAGKELPPAKSALTLP